MDHARTCPSDASARSAAVPVRPGVTIWATLGPLVVGGLAGLVLARSAMHHSMNYRCVVLFGVATKVTDEAEKRRAFDAIVDHSVPGRSALARPANDSELRATLVLRLPIDEGSAKVRTGGPVDDADDLDRPVWAGEIPLRVVAGESVQDPAQSAAQFVGRSGAALAAPARSARGA